MPDTGRSVSPPDQDSVLRLPAEWEPQAALILTWPHAGGDWGSLLPAADACFLSMAHAVLGRQRLIISCADPHRARRLEQELGHEAEIVVLPSNDVWVRDHGPLAVLAGTELSLLDCRFDGWGGKYPASEDDRLTGRLAARGVFGTLPLLRSERVLEGGSIDTDGLGTLLTTRECLLRNSRNGGLGEQAFDRWFSETLGCSRVLWLEHGWLEGDDTDAHVDMLARFVNPETLVFSHCDNAADPHWQPLQALGRELGTLTGASGQPLQVVPLPWPEARYAPDGERLPLSYANIAFVEQGLLVPVYGQPSDDRALDLYRALCPGRDIIPIDALALVHQHGSVHCATLHLPDAKRLLSAGRNG